MAKSSNYRVQLRRRRACKTDYQARKAMVTSGRPRLVARPSLRNITAQIIIAKPHGDQVLAAANSRELNKFGWKTAKGNIPSAYLTGFLCGLKAKTTGVTNAILDIGLAIPTKGAKVFAVLNGVTDAGIEVPHSEEKIVKERIKGNHIAKYAKSLGTGSDEYTIKYSNYVKQKIAPENLPELFNKVKNDIVTHFEDAKVTAESPKKSSPKEKMSAIKVTVVAKEKVTEVKTAKEIKLKTKNATEKVATKAAISAKKSDLKEKSTPKEKTSKAKVTKVTKEKAMTKKVTSKEKLTKKSGKKA